MSFTIKGELEDDGRWLAESHSYPACWPTALCMSH